MSKYSVYTLLAIFFLLVAPLNARAEWDNHGEQSWNEHNRGESHGNNHGHGEGHRHENNDDRDYNEWRPHHNHQEGYEDSYEYAAPPQAYVDNSYYYVQPEPVYIQPTPIYVRPRPVYIQPEHIFSFYFGR